MFRRLLEAFRLTPPVTDEIDEFNRFDTPANSFLRPRTSGLPTYLESKSVRRIDARRATLRPINGHPDMHHYFWFEAGAKLPPICRWVIVGTASFAHPDTNVIFARVTTTLEFRVRIPRSELVQFSELKWEIDESRTDSVWITSRLRLDEDQRLLAIAHGAAGS